MKVNYKINFVDLFQKTQITYLFYIYDLFKFFIPYTNKKINNIKTERNSKIVEEKMIRGINKIDNDKIDNLKKDAKNMISNYTNDSLITKISYLFEDQLSTEQVKYYLTAMKEFIHGINLKGGNNVLKKQIIIKQMKILILNIKISLLEIHILLKEIMKN